MNDFADFVERNGVKINLGATAAPVNEQVLGNDFVDFWKKVDFRVAF